MSVACTAPTVEVPVPPQTADFYRRALEALSDARVPFLVGGAFAHAHFTGIQRATKDLDLFIRRRDYEQVERLMQAHGWRTELAYPHWLAKAYAGEDFIDFIFNSGNGVLTVDDQWFCNNTQAEVFGVPVRLANPEDSLLSKSFIMERERFDGADIAHLLQAHAERLDWPVLLQRFGRHWRVLLAHLALFGYIYPGERHRVPGWVMEQLMARLAHESTPGPPSDTRVCAGTLLSREQYLYDVEQLGYLDGRLTAASSMTAEDVAGWTGAIQRTCADAQAPEASPIGENASPD